MTKSQIKAELRRAAESADPWLEADHHALIVAYKFETMLCERDPENVSTFFLLVAEAL